MQNIFSKRRLMAFLLGLLAFLSVNVWAQETVTPEMPPEVHEKVAAVTVKISNDAGKPGSGAIVAVLNTSLGDLPLILTACHVVASNFEDAVDPFIALKFYQDIQVKIPGEISSVPAKVIPEFVDRANDVALLRTNQEVLVNQVINYSEKAKPGKQIAAFGYPQTDIINQTVGRITREQGNYYVFDARVEPGNSGGPLVDDKGRLVGLVTYKEDEHEGYALKSNLVATVVNNWLQRVKPKKKWQFEKDGSFLTSPWFIGGVVVSAGAGIFVLTNSGSTQDTQGEGFPIPPGRPGGN